MILRHWDTTYTEAEIRGHPHFDGFVFSIGHGQEELAAEYAAKGYRAWTYFNVLTIPPPEWADPLPPYLATVRALCPPLMDPQTITGAGAPEPVKSWSGGRQLIDWAQMGPHIDDLADMVIQELNAVKGAYGAFHDLAWRQPEDWMMVPPEVYAIFPTAKWTLWEENFARFQAATGPRNLTLSNGDRSIPAPLYLEYAEKTWDRDYAIWFENEDTVLSVNAADTEAVESLSAEHEKHKKKWIAFSGGSKAEADAAYELAATAASKES
jgi:hypothetical protein